MPVFNGPDREVFRQDPFPDFDRWIIDIFDHPDPYAGSVDGKPRSDNWWSNNVTLYDSATFAPSEVCRRIAETFAGAGALLARFSEGQIAAGVMFLVDPVNDISTRHMRDPSVSVGDASRLYSATVPLFSDLFAKVCTDDRSDVGASREEDDRPCDSLCFMFWDLLEFHIPDAVLPAATKALRAILKMNHALCKASAVHGIGHLSHRAPEAARILADEFLTAQPLAPKWIRDFANRAKEGARM